MIEVVTDHEAFLRLREPWNALAADFPNPILQHECAVACDDAFGANGTLAIFVVRSGSDIRAIAPFHLVRRGGIPRLQTLTRPLWEPAGFLYCDEDALRDLLGALLTHRRPMTFARFAADGPEMRTLREMTRDRAAFPRIDRSDSSIWVPLCADSQQFEAAMSSGRRSYIRRKWRRAERMGDVRFEALAPDEHAAVPALQEAYAVEAKSWKARNGSAILMTPHFKRFFTQYGRSLARLGMLRLYVLRIGGEAVAVRIAVQHANRLWELKIGYDERYRECSPGILLTHETLRHACGRGLSAFEFLGQAEDWEHAWTEQVRHYTSLTLHPMSLEGGLSLAQDLMRGTAKTILKVLRGDAESRKERARKAGAATAPACDV